VDGLDLIVGTVISAVVAGLGAAVAAFVGTVVSRSATSISMIAWAIGGVFMSGAYLLVFDLPERADLIALEPSVVHHAYVDQSINGDVLRLYDAMGRTVTVSPRKGYYSNLVTAIDSSQNYRVLYARKRALFSSYDDFYTVVYEVSVNGETLESYDIRLNQLKLVCTGAFAFGLVMFVGGFMVPGRSAPERVAEPETV